MPHETKTSLLEKLFISLPAQAKNKIGSYDQVTQTWSHRDGQVMSPVKNNKEN